ncbi:hypothetical protein MKW94_010294, partial [Papaver nudicaule]|nr:hypothetical protein [Papaver nudicaule]
RRMHGEGMQLLQQPGFHVGEVVEVIGESKVLVKVHPEGEYVVDIDIDRSVSMKAVKVPDSTYDSLEHQIEKLVE